jgi:hypothetical protein
MGWCEVDASESEAATKHKPITRSPAKVLELWGWGGGVGGKEPNVQSMWFYMAACIMKPMTYMTPNKPPQYKMSSDFELLSYATSKQLWC